MQLVNMRVAITVIPKYGVGLDLKDGDLAIFDVHELTWKY